MLNRNSAIKENYKIGKYPFEDKIEIVFSENHNLVIQQIAAWPDEISNVEKLFSDELGVKQNIDFNRGEIFKNSSNYLNTMVMIRKIALNTRNFTNPYRFVGSEDLDHVH